MWPQNLDTDELLHSVSTQGIVYCLIRERYFKMPWDWLEYFWDLFTVLLGLKDNCECHENRACFFPRNLPSWKWPCVTEQCSCRHVAQARVHRSWHTGEQTLTCVNIRTLLDVHHLVLVLWWSRATTPAGNSPIHRRHQGWVLRPQTAPHQGFNQHCLRHGATVINDYLQDLITLNALLWQSEVQRETSAPVCQQKYQS